MCIQNTHKVRRVVASLVRVNEERGRQYRLNRNAVGDAIVPRGLLGVPTTRRKIRGDNAAGGQGIGRHAQVDHRPIGKFGRLHRIAGFVPFAKGWPAVDHQVPRRPKWVGIDHHQGMAGSRELLVAHCDFSGPQAIGNLLAARARTWFDSRIAPDNQMIVLQVLVGHFDIPFHARRAAKQPLPAIEKMLPVRIAPSARPAD